MRDILLIFIMMMLGVWSAKAFGIYTPTIEDTTLLDSLEIKVSRTYEHSPQKIEAIGEKLSRSLPAFGKDTQAGYILTQLAVIIDIQLQTGYKERERSNEMIHALSNQFQ